MERVYFKVVGDFIFIHDRKSHKMVESVANNARGKKELKKILAMTTKEYYTYLVVTKHIDFKLDTKVYGQVKDMSLIDAEEWYQKAWMTTTNRLLKELGLKMVCEEQPDKVIKDLMKQTHKSTGWDVETKKVTEALREDKEDKVSSAWDKLFSLLDEDLENKPKKKLIKKKAM